jgi:UDP-N-acetylmuramate dehydrogenase
VPRTPSLADRTTLGVGGPADDWLRAQSEEDLIAGVRDADRSGIPVLLLGGGSNMLVADEGFRGTVVEIGNRGVAVEESVTSVLVTAAAGEPWDALVERCVNRRWSGLEALSGIPGRVGATPVQNVGAYGQDVGQSIDRVRVLDRTTGQVRTIPRDDCGFGYRTSVFKREPDRWVVVSVDLRLGTTGLGEVRYTELARFLGVQVGDYVDVDQVRAAVLSLRRAKGMVLDADDPDTRSVGSFFMNPIVADEEASMIPAECPRYPAPEGVKLSAAWLIENSGVSRGFRVRADSAAAVSTKHTLALTNVDDASAHDVLELARVIREHVRDTFGITLRPEARLVNCAL